MEFKKVIELIESLAEEELSKILMYGNDKCREEYAYAIEDINTIEEETNTDFSVISSNRNTIEKALSGKGKKMFNILLAEYNGND